MGAGRAPHDAGFEEVLGDLTEAGRADVVDIIGEVLLLERTTGRRHGAAVGEEPVVRTDAATDRIERTPGPVVDIGVEDAIDRGEHRRQLLREQ